MLGPRVGRGLARRRGRGFTGIDPGGRYGGWRGIRHAHQGRDRVSGAVGGVLDERRRVWCISGPTRGRCGGYARLQAWLGALNDWEGVGEVHTLLETLGGSSAWPEVAWRWLDWWWQKRVGERPTLGDKGQGEAELD